MRILLCLRWIGGRPDVDFVDGAVAVGAVADEVAWAVVRPSSTATALAAVHPASPSVWVVFFVFSGKWRPSTLGWRPAWAVRGTMSYSAMIVPYSVRDKFSPNTLCWRVLGSFGPSARSNGNSRFSGRIHCTPGAIAYPMRSPGKRRINRSVILNWSFQWVYSLILPLIDNSIKLTTDHSEPVPSHEITEEYQFAIGNIDAINVHLLIAHDSYLACRERLCRSSVCLCQCVWVRMSVFFFPRKREWTNTRASILHVRVSSSFINAYMSNGHTHTTLTCNESGNTAKMNTGSRRRRRSRQQ